MSSLPLPSSSSFVSFGSGVVYEDKIFKITQHLVGYANDADNTACGSVTSVCIADFTILVDCGLPSTDLSKDLIPPLCKDKVDCVIVTHWHSDHCGRLHDFAHVDKIFPEEPVTELPYMKIESRGLQNAKDYVQLLSLNGHSTLDLVLVVRPNKNNVNVIVVVGDLFENLDDYKLQEPAVCGLNSAALLKSRRIVREIHPTIIVPGHGPAFGVLDLLWRLKWKRLDEKFMIQMFDATPLYDTACILAIEDKLILINPRDSYFDDFYVDFIKFDVIVVLKPSKQCATAIGKFKADLLYMGEDVLQWPNVYRQLAEPEILANGRVRVSKGDKPQTLKITVNNAENNEILFTLPKTLSSHN